MKIKVRLAKIYKPIRDVASEVRSCDINVWASSLAYMTVISLVPLLAVSLSVFNAMGGFEHLVKVVEPLILNSLIGESSANVQKAIQRAIQRIHSGALGTMGVLLLFLTSTQLFWHMDLALQRIWRLEKKRSVPRRLIAYWLVMFLGPLVLAGLVGLASSKDLFFLKKIPKSTFSFLGIWLALIVLYKWVPRTEVRWRAVLWSSLAAAVSIVVLQSMYTWMTKKILAYSKIYGSLASVPMFLLWILLLWRVVLVGVAICKVLNTNMKNRTEGVFQ